MTDNDYGDYDDDNVDVNEIEIIVTIKQLIEICNLQ